jgi:thioredoxin 1
MAVIDATVETFEKEVLDYKGVVLVDFWAEWCGPCKMVAPILDQMAEELGEELKIVKVDVDNNSPIAEFYEVTSIPTMKVFVDGEPVHQWTGAKPKAGILKELESYL